jgi:hypothetical protein
VIFAPVGARVASDRDQFTGEQLDEARRIAAELVKLRDAGAIAGPDDPEAVFFAYLLRDPEGRSSLTNLTFMKQSNNQNDQRTDSTPTTPWRNPMGPP